MKWEIFSINKLEFSLKHRVLNILLVFGMVMCILHSIFNYLFSFTIVTMICVACLGVLLGIYYISFVKKQYKLAMPLAIIIFFIIIPAVWFFNGGSAGGTAFFILISSSMIVVLLSGRMRIAVLACLVIMTAALLLIEYTNPQWVVSYVSGFDRYSDYTFSLLVALVINAFLYVIISNQYDTEHNRVREYEKNIEEKNQEIKMMQMDRMNLIGEMAASIGHEVRNPLTTVRGFLQFMQSKEKYVDDSETLHIMIEELDRANGIITEFLALAKNKAVQLKPDNLNRIVNVLLPLLKADGFRLGKQLTVELGDIPDLLLDENEIRQCIINLVRNGFEAMEGEGKVELKTYQVGGNVVLEVLDNGKGIPEEIYGKLGMPFITSKPNGTGIGIPICIKIANRHNAKFELKTSPSGTAALLTFSKNT